MMLKKTKQIDLNIDLEERFYLSSNGNIIYKVTISNYFDFPLDLQLETIDLI